MIVYQDEDKKWFYELEDFDAIDVLREVANYMEDNKIYKIVDLPEKVTIFMYDYINDKDAEVELDTGDYFRRIV